VTVYPGTTTVTADTTTFTFFSVPTRTTGLYSTITVPTPSGFLSIESSLPNAAAPPYYIGLFPAGKRSAVADSACVTVTRTQLSTTILPPLTTTTVTTVSNLAIGFPSQSTTLDSAGLAAFLATYTGPLTTTATVSRTLTNYRTYALTTVTLPTQTVSGRNTTVYAACRRENFAGQVILGPATSDAYLLYDTATERVPGSFTDAYGCCVAALLLPDDDDDVGGVGFWQWSPRTGSCFVERVGASSSPSSTEDGECVQSGNVFTVNTLEGGSPSSERQFEGRVIGNGRCGRVTGAVRFPGAGEGSGVA
jgi:hypothetical protein